MRSGPKTLLRIYLQKVIRSRPYQTPERMYSVIRQKILILPFQGPLTWKGDIVPHASEHPVTFNYPCHYTIVAMLGTEDVIRTIRARCIRPTALDYL